MLVACLLPIIFIFLSLFLQKKDGGSIEVTFLSRTHTDILRAIAMMLIILCHAASAAGAKVFTPVGGMAVAIFLILSGYGITVSYMKNGLKHFWKKKITRIWLPYLLLLLVVAITGEYNGRMTPLNFSLDVLCLRTSYWFISFLIYNYVLFFISHKVAALRRYKYTLFILFALVIVIFDRHTEAEQCLSFVTGVWIAYNKEKAQKILLNPFLMISFLLITVIAFGLKQYTYIGEEMANNDLLNNVVYILIKFSFALFVIGLISPPLIHRKCLIIKGL